MLSFEFICVLPNGVHARPANELELRTTPFSADITLINHSKQTRADAKSVLSLVSADITEQDHCELQFVGDDQQHTPRPIPPAHCGPPFRPGGTPFA